MNRLPPNEYLNIVPLSPPPSYNDLSEAINCKSQLQLFNLAWIEQTSRLDECNGNMHSIIKWTDEYNETEEND